ncbi:uncharacterized protein LOC131218739 [Magnolia sinica]|uniref:uncharacterized protein LOC131218739 n=1 Tax=Magnolia sinica TaxID=86752 RepID=UPI002657B07B|nr:uncharacterized protein LOC131218739 [Magnolia sinica]
MEIHKKTVCITQNKKIFVQTEKVATRGRTTGSGGKGRQPSQNPHQNRNIHQNSGQNRQRLEAGGTQSLALRAAAHVQNSGRVVQHSAAPRGNGSGGGRGSGGGQGGGGAHHVARQSSSNQAVKIAARATTGASGRASGHTANSISVTLRGSSTKSATHFPGASQSHSSNKCFAHISLRQGHH